MRTQPRWKPTRGGLAWLLGYAGLVAAVPWGVRELAPNETPSLAAAMTDSVAVDVRARAPHTDALAGVWWRNEFGRTGDPVRFYYFHGDGNGLYRYGRVGLTQTHSFAYEVAADSIAVTYRKTGRVHEVGYRLELGRTDDENHARDVLVLRGDPEEPQAEVRYFRDRRGPIGPHTRESPPAPGPPPAGHMWIDLQRYATGGMGFHFYQLRPAGIDGRGVGWYHRGDFDDWTTEALNYRIAGSDIEFEFPLVGERSGSRFEVRALARGRELVLAGDPRDFGHHHRLRDVGPSFGTAQLGVLRVAGLASLGPGRAN